MQIADALRALSGRLASPKRRQQQRRENDNDGDHDEELNEAEAATAMRNACAVSANDERSAAFRRQRAAKFQCDMVKLRA